MMDAFIYPGKASVSLAFCLLSLLCVVNAALPADTGRRLTGDGVTTRSREPVKAAEEGNKDKHGSSEDVSAYYVESPESFSYTPELSQTCAGDTFLLIFVCSALENFEHRRMIRETWGSFQSNSPSSPASSAHKLRWNCSDELLPHLRQTRLIFHVGLPHQRSPSSVLRAAEEESVKHRDVIRGDFVDTYRNLSVKSVSMLRWMAKFCPAAKFLMKTDDDMFINLPLLLKDLTNVVHKKFLMGDIITAAKPIRDKNSKWYTPVAAYSNFTYPRYISGAAYVISGDLIKNLTDAVGKKSFWIEDVYITGQLAQKVHATLIFNGKFRYSRKYFHPCFLKLVIAAHRLDPVTLQTMWGAFHDSSLGCDYDML